jgi:hypothetical protein
MSGMLLPKPAEKRGHIDMWWRHFLFAQGLSLVTSLPYLIACFSSGVISVRISWVIFVERVGDVGFAGFEFQSHSREPF